MAKKVIVVENDGPIRKLCVDYLTHARLEVRAYDSAEKTLEELERDKTYDAILTSFILRGKMNGIELIGQIKERYNIPVFMMSGGDRERQAKDAGAAGYIPKPFSVHDLDVLLE